MDAEDHQSSSLMNMHLCEIGITICFSRETLEFKVGSYHSNWSLQHFQGCIFAQEKNY